MFFAEHDRWAARNLHRALLEFEELTNYGVDQHTGLLQRRVEVRNTSAVWIATYFVHTAEGTGRNRYATQVEHDLRHFEQHEARVRFSQAAVHYWRPRQMATVRIMAWFQAQRRIARATGTSASFITWCGNLQVAALVEAAVTDPTLFTGW